MTDLGGALTRREGSMAGAENGSGTGRHTGDSPLLLTGLKASRSIEMARAK